jgi:hypothetical protein
VPVIDSLLGPLLGRRAAGDEAKWRVPPGVVLRRGRWLPALGGICAGMRGPAAAVTIGRTIVLHPAIAISGALLRHELEHVRQWRERPLAFPLRYVVHHFRFGYRNNPYEVAARRAEAGPTREERS